MAAKKNADTDLKAKLLAEVEGVAGVDRVLVNNLIDKVVAANEFTDDLCDRVRKQGTMIEMERGGANNRHMEMVENPALTSFNKSVARLADLSMKVSKVAKGNNGSEEEDELIEFIRR